MNLAAILKIKGGSVLSVAPETLIIDVIKILGEKRIGALIVIDETEKIVGILSERDIVRMLAQHSNSIFQMTVDQVVTRSIRVAKPQTSIAEAMELMTQGRFRHLPVVEDGRLLGLVSIGDVVKARLSQQEHEVDSLRAYVAG